MKITTVVLAATLAITACSATDALRLVKPNGGVDVEAQIGKDASKQVVLGDQVRNEVNAEAVQGDLVSTNNTVSTQFTGNMQAGSFTVNNMPTQKLLAWTGLIIFLLGVLFPSPFEIWRWFKEQLGLIRGKSK